MSNPDAMYSIDYQRQVLKLLCVNLKFFNDYGSLLKNDYFETEFARIVFSLINKHILTYQRELDQGDLQVKVDEYVVQKGFGHEIAVLLKDEVKETFKTYIRSEEWLIDTLTNFCRRQELRNAIQRSMDMLSKDSENSYEKVLKEINDAIAVGTGSSSDGLTFEDLITIQERLRERYSPDKLVKTGFRSLDAALGGGVAPGEVHIFMGTPKIGKTTFAVNVGANALTEGKTVFHVTLEIPDIDIANKYGVRLTGMTYAEMNNIRSGDYQEKIKKFYKYKPKLFINHWPEGTANTLHIRSWIAKMRAKHNVNPDLLIVDYDDCLIPVRGSKDDMYNDAGEIYKDLIALANHFKIPIISFAQPKREAWEVPNKGELMKAGDISHSARKIHRLFSISSLNFADESKTGILYLDRNRRGESNVKIKLKRDLSRALFLQDE